MSIVEVKNLSFKYLSHDVLNNINFAVEKGEFVSIVGPNGTGKSTLLKILSGFLEPSGGEIIFDGKEIKKTKPHDLAKKRAFVTQDNSVNFPYKSIEIVMMGRFPYSGLLEKETKEDEDIVKDVMEKTSVWNLASRPVTELSGGERQRVMIAKALAQKPRVLFLDEPTASFDINYQIDILDYIKTLNREEGVTVLMVIHDLNLASQYSDRIILLKNGSIHSFGRPSEVITEKNIEDVFSIKVKIEKDEKGLPSIFLKSNVIYGKGP